MDFLILGIGVGLWAYSFINYRYNDQPWISSSLIFGLGSAVIIAAIILIFTN